MSEISSKAIWPGWKTVRLLGRGSFGAVYEIERDVFGTVEKAALKVISIPQNESDIEELVYSGYSAESITETFKTHLKGIVNEYTLMRKMKGSSYIVDCDDFQYIEHDGTPGWDILIKMELLTPLFKALGTDCTEETVIKLAKDMCSALILCRENNIIHRDIKPQNIFASKYGTFKLGDFGIAKTIEKTSGGTRTGTYKYMAPEVYNNKPYSYTADIYSLGMVMHWLLNERRSPFVPLPPELPTASAEEAARIKRMSGEPLPAPKNGSAKLKAIILKACAFDPQDRYQSAAEMLEDLDKLSKGQPVSAAKKPAAPVNNTYEASPDDATVGSFIGGAAKVAESIPEDDATVGPFGKAAAKAVEEDSDDDSTVGLFAKPQPDKKPKKQASAAKAQPKTEPAAAKAQPKPDPATTKQPKKNVGVVQDEKLADLMGGFFGDPAKYGNTTAKKTLFGTVYTTKPAKPQNSKKKLWLLAGLGVLAVLFIVWFAFFRTAVVPYITKYSRADAEKRLQAQGFKNYTFQTVESSSIPKGLVVSTDPRYGTEYRINEKVTVYISSGPGTVTVPNLVGKSETAALNALKNAGLETDGIARAYTPDVKKGYVISQDPAAGTTAYKGSKVHLSVSAGPETHYLNFNPNGGQVSETKRVIAEGSRFGTLPTPTRTGYTFSGWFTAVNGGTQISSNTKMGTSGITVYAHWTKQ